MATIYEYNGKTLFEDTEDEHTIEGIQAHFANHFAELTQATYTVIPAKDDIPRKVVFAKTVGTKGCEVVERLLTLRPRAIESFTLLAEVEADSSTENLLRLAARIEAAIPKIEMISYKNRGILERCQKLPAVTARTLTPGF